ncbi:hypothetical protein K3152_13465 [Qipengyuania sp. 1NDH17]|uniref:Uncharacterized protein n=1 Tax=Qipengyuania polymorpha TaxID=2867234 RepID=A0ABS7J0B3_9SPHN|nr:hypothetical protein [Qipengyuania polymorpha]MBX7459256.1 hypothetical protein [Qipengyuania polymorpha]
MKLDASQFSNDEIAEILAKQLEAVEQEAIAFGLPRAAIGMGFARAARRIREAMERDGATIN